jgi:hypothetical protein
MPTYRILALAAVLALPTHNAAHAAGKKAPAADKNMWCYQFSNLSGAPACTYATEEACYTKVLNSGGTCYLSPAGIAALMRRGVPPWYYR